MQMENKDFDQLMRSMLQDAEVEAPKGSWEAISAALDKAEAKKKPITLWWKRAAAASAVAAAMVAGVFLFKDTPKQDNIDVVAQSNVTPLMDNSSANGSFDASEEVSEPVEVVPSAGRNIVAVAGPSKSANASSYVPSAVTSAGKVASDYEAEEVSENKTAEVVPEGVAEETPKVVSEVVTEDKAEAIEEVKESAKDKTPAEETFVDPFAGLQEESYNKPSRLSFTAGGNFQTNGSATAAKPSTFKVNGSGVYSETTIVQDSKDSKYAVPITLGAGVRYHFDNKWSLGTGLTYSRLERNFDGTYYEGGTTNSMTGNVRHTIHYVGIPLNVYYELMKNDKLHLYSFAGGAIEKGIYNNYVIKSGSSTTRFHPSVKGVMPSLQAGFGLEYRVNSLFGIYADPSFKYYFKGNQPTSIRTQQPLMFNFELGLRFDL